MPALFHPLLALIASATNNELAKYVEYLKEENKILRARIPGQIHTKPEERERLLKLGKIIGRAIEELITIVSPGTFFSVKTVTKKGLKDMYVLVWLCMTTREVIVSESTLHPNSAWVTKQADWFVDQTAGRDKPPSIVMHDKDTKFSKEFTEKLKERDVRTNSLPKASPNLNGRCERVIQTLNEVCSCYPCCRASFGRDRGDRSATPPLWTAV